MSTGRYLVLLLLLSCKTISCDIWWGGLGTGPRTSTGTGSNTGTGTGSNTGTGIETSMSPTLTTTSDGVGSHPAMSCGGVEYKSFTYLEQRIYTFESEVFSDYDLSTEGVWYGELGYKLLDVAPGVLHCGGRYPAWVQGINGGDPDGEHQLTICMQTAAKPCFKTWTIHALSCQNQTIYKLTKTPGDDTVYCVDYVDEHNRPSTHTIDSCSVEIQTGETLFSGFVFFLCNFDKLGISTLQYQTYWFVNGISVSIKSVAPWTDNFVNSSRLTEDDLEVSGFTKFGFDVRCSVRVRDTADGFPGPPRTSPPQFAGIKIVNQTISVKQGQTKSLSVTSTVPIKCGTKFPDCRVRLEVTAPKSEDNTECKPETFVQTDCNVPLKDANVEYDITVLGEIIVDNGEFNGLTKLKLTTISNEMPFFSDYEVGIVSVEVTKDGSTNINVGKVCHAVCDPHMLTFDGRYYEHQFTGHFVLYKNYEHNIEVQMSTTPCYNTPKCPCAIAVRSGRTVFRLDRCAGEIVPWEIGFASCGDHLGDMIVKKKGSLYEVFLPTGTTIKVFLQRLYLNVYIYPSFDDINHTSGLCGTLTGDCSDDFKLKNGAYSTATNARAQCSGAGFWETFQDFSSSWSLDRNKSLFDDDFVNDLAANTNVPFSYCGCKPKQDPSSTSGQNSVVCSANKAKQCKYPPNFTGVTQKNRCSISKRKRRSADIGPVPVIRKRRSTVWIKGWTEQSARAYCEGLFNVSTAITTCQNIDEKSIEQSKEDCILDIQLTGDTYFSDMAVETAKEQCGRKVMMNATVAARDAAANESNKGLWEQFQRVSCTNECSHRGTCVEGECQCETGYGALDCSVDISEPPKTFGLREDGVCDVASHPCNVSHVLTEYIVENSYSNCRTKFFEIDNNNTITYGEVLTRTLEVESFAEGVCSLPAARLEVSVSPTVAHGYLVSVSNNGQTFSDESAVVIFNSTCQECDVNNNVVTCSFVSQACKNGDVCVPVGSPHPLDNCHVCSDGQWVPSTAFDKRCNPDNNVWIIIVGALVGTLVLGLLIALAMWIFFHFSSPPTSNSSAARKN